MTIDQYQTEERTMTAYRVADAGFRIMELFNVMRKDIISTPEKVFQLKTELSEFYNNPRFLKCKTMGEIVKLNLKFSGKLFALTTKKIRRC